MAEVSKLQRAEKVRTEYVNKLSERGIQLNRTGSLVICLTETGKVVGMPCAADTKRSPDGGWWMGLPNVYLDFVILLCQTEAEATLDFVLPRTFLLEVRGSLYTQYQNGGFHHKYDVRRHGDEYELKLKGRRVASKNISNFLGQIERVIE